MSNLVGLIIQLLSGAIGGNVAGNLLKQYDLGAVGNSLAGILGGGIGGQLLAAVLGRGSVLTAGPANGNMDIGSIIAQVVGGGVGGGILMTIIGIIRQAMSAQSARP
jgi:hypothetical protein